MPTADNSNSLDMAHSFSPLPYKWSKSNAIDGMVYA